MVALLSGLLLMPLPVLAENGPDAEQTADWTQRLERASELQREGRRLQEAADQAFEAESKACFSRFQVNACQQVFDVIQYQQSLFIPQVIDELLCQPGGILEPEIHCLSLLRL